MCALLCSQGFVHVIVGSCAHGVMAVWVGSCAGWWACVGWWLHRFMGLCGLMPAWVCGYAGLWLRGFLHIGVGLPDLESKLTS
ncbi:hypothetical protein BS47DRAFT_208827 [Hydnum rufescens UP504]|uniref:Uncharacterized protein n=1 Tax=Hydnum rufescens UP504 TaxID=1448309 RepID=A0A9P6ANP0_9AGAM|nr:hypothetical protein BS47DRAFT_208827 [Hydnum rufescens UP504]